MSTLTQQPFVNTLIRASAGSGKTYRLSSRYLGIVAYSGRPDEILATTFTRKAAGEILDRIMLRLAEAAADPAKLTELNASLEGLPLSKQECIHTLRQIPQQMHRLQVKTLDSHFIRLAQCFSFELGLPPDWTILDDVDDQRLRMEAVGRVLAEGETGEVIRLMHLLSKGSSERSVSKLVMNCVNDMYGIFLDSKEPAWEVLKLAPAPNEREVEESVVVLETFEADGKGLQKALVSDVEQFRAGQWHEFLKNGLAAKVAAGEDTYSRKPIPDVLCHSYRILIRHAHSILLGRVVEQNRGAYQLLKQFHEHYERLKWQRRAYRFEDVTRRLSQALLTNTEIQNLFRLDRKIEHLLLDEFQDTSPVQWEVIRPVAQKISEQPQDRSLLCVGDMKQAIYAWRGGVAEIFTAVEETLPGIQAVAMDHSYRSSPIIMETVNKIFTKLADFPSAGKMQRGITHWLKFFNEHKTERRNLAGHVTLESAPLNREGKPDEQCVLALTADRVAELAQKAPHVSIGVLVRTNATIADMIYLLRERNVLASEEGGNPLTDSAAVQLVLSLLEWIDHPGNTIARYHVAESALGEVLGESAKSDAAWEQTANDLRRQLLVEGYGAVIGRWAGLIRPHCSPREERRLEQLERLAFAWQSKTTLRCRDFIRFIESQRVGDSSSAAVRVMNIHQSKGLEFDAVFLPELDNQIPPQASSFVLQRDRQIGPVCGVTHYISETLQPLLPVPIQQMFEESQQKDVVESLCVLYVALTRAVHALHLVIKPRPKPKQADGPKRSFAGIVLNGLAETPYPEEQQLLYEAGDAEWYASVESEAAKADEANPPGFVRQPIRLQTAGKATPGEFVTPSSLEGGRLRRVKSLLDLPAQSTGMQYGSAMHQWFEAIQWLEDFRPDRSAMIAAARSQFGEFAYEAAYDNFAQLLKAAETAKLLSEPGYLESPWWPGPTNRVLVEQEFPFAITHHEQRLRGSIDRLVLILRDDQVIAADVIDFKTDTFDDEAALHLKQQHYRPQIDSYRAAVAKIFRLPSEAVRGTLFFVHSPTALHWQEQLPQ